MKHFAALLATLAIAVPANAALPVGAKAPAFTTQAALGGKQFTFVLKSALRKGPVVLYFFPAAFTKGCTIEAHEFALAASDFSKNGATLIGLSADPIDKLADFSKVECREAFPVGVAAPATVTGYDVHIGAGKTMTNRTSYVIAPDGKIIYALTQMSPAGHVTGTMDAVKAWRAKRKG
ncbi:MAG: peroxiredoxin [Sphingomonas bacterium]|uniref:peroxiredoxin n=1 Tax=Sphingomonas bacterium TaxID=1895847 RepID=UPI00262DE4E6|nr:peroxiredoxin [Sphingomonas bacterium]MDB5706330.1 peroxiredoxin [Sphingomonas bacterium]